ncbi:MAG: hypothetical protein IH628_01325, partial [Proteobacteria bacterium]|nr:hypothetical protein [Pseudomonadota bacterium]
MAFREYRSAKVCFAVSALVLFGRAIMWARVTNIPFWGRTAICLIIFGAIGVAIVESMRWIDRKKLEFEYHPTLTSTKEELPPAPSPIATPQHEKIQGKPGSASPEQGNRKPTFKEIKPEHREPTFKEISGPFRVVVGSNSIILSEANTRGNPSHMIQFGDVASMDA